MNGYTSIQITDDLQGRFGNQLFRIASIIGQSKKNNVNYYVPKEWKHLHIFPNLKVDTINNIQTNINNTFSENGFNFNEFPYPDKLTEVKGYFQSWKYFEGYENELREEMSINKSLIDIVKSKYNPTSKKLCVHVRWGDNWDRDRGGGHKGVEDYHPIMSFEYYDNAIKYILSKVQVDEILIFTDNDDTKEFISGKFEKYGVNIIYCDYHPDFLHDFISQYLCDYFIIANSTFSWWSAYLSNGTDKIVCCPNNYDWFGNSYKHFNTDDLLPPNWVRINQNY